MGLIPLSDHVVIKRLEREAVSEGGIVLPDVAKDKPVLGEVIAVGPGRILDNGQRLPPEVKKGQKVLFSKYGGNEVKYKGEEYLILREDDILAIVED
ncbi:MAG: co-chaperone GroES [bacterium JZ-2024 1]